MVAALSLLPVLGGAGEKCPDQVLPEGYSDRGGWMITDPYAKVPQYALSLASRRDGGDTLFLSRLLFNDEQGCAHWKIVYSFELPKRQAGTDLAFECRVNGLEDRAVLAFARKVDEREEASVVSAWRVMIEEEKIVAIPTTGIVCTNQGYGL